MSKQITSKVSWVGKVDWELTRFHGDEYSTHRGSSYNSYLIRDQKAALIDTVWQPYDREFVSRLKQEIDLRQIDYIIMQHNEIDHSGALPETAVVIKNIARDDKNNIITEIFRSRAILVGSPTINNGIAKLWVPDRTAVDECREYGREFAKAILPSAND